MGLTNKLNKLVKLMAQINGPGDTLWTHSVWRIVGTPHQIFMSSPRCTLLNAETVCGKDFSGYPVLFSDYPTSANFSAQLTQTLGTSAAIAQQVALPRGAACTGPAVKTLVDTLRFQFSIFCSREVQIAIDAGCKPTAKNPKGPLLCADSCSKAIDSLETFLSTESACPKVAPGNTRASLVSSFKDYCTKADISLKDNNGFCTIGAPLETQQCGIFN
jgi:hypothetical protein